MYEDDAIYKLTDKISTGNYFIVAPKVILPNGEIQESNKIRRPNYIHYLKNETYLNKFFRDKNVEKENKREVYWVAGCCFAVNLKMFQKINFFDKNTFLYYEEYIISEKALKEKFRILYDPSIKVIHHHGISMGDVNVNIYLEHFRSEMYYWIRYRKINKVQAFIIYIIRNLEIKISLNKRKRNSEYSTFKENSKSILEEINRRYR